MAVTVDNLELGPCQVEYDGTDIGATEGGVTLTIEDVVADVKADQLGDIPAKQILIGRRATVRVPVAENTIENFQKFLPGSTLQGTTQKRVDIETNVGLDLLSQAKQLVLKPLEGGSPTTDEHKWFTFYKAAVVGTRELSYSRDTQRIMEIEFVCYPDSTNNNDLGFRGYSTPS